MSLWGFLRKYRGALLGFILGITSASIIGYFSLYNLLTAFLDKPFFQSHGSWIMGSLIFAFVTIRVSMGAIEANNKTTQTMLQTYIADKQLAKPKTTKK